MTDDPAVAASDLHDRLRRLLLQRFPYDPLENLAAALAYELASIIATHAATKADAFALVLRFAENQVAQIRELGVGKPHP